MSKAKVYNHKMAIEALPNPQNPYSKRKGNGLYGSSASFTSSTLTNNRKMPRSGSIQVQQAKPLPPLKELKEFQAPQPPNSILTGKSSHTFSQANERYLRHESVLEAFLVNTMTCPLHAAIEQTIQITLKAESVTLWQDIPTLHMLYSKRLGKSVNHSTGLVGFTFFEREVVKCPVASAHTAYSPEIDGLVAPGQTPMLLFPLWDSNSNVCAVVQVTKDPKNQFFDSEDEDFIQFFIKKFKIYSYWLHLPKIPHEVVHEVTQIMQLEQFLLTFNRKISSLFECNNCELWRYNLSLKELHLYRKTVSKIDPAKAGIVGEALRKECPVNCPVSKLQSTYYEPIDGPDPEPVLVVPILDVKQNCKFAIALRGRKTLPVFTSEDERLLRILAPYLVLALDNCEKYSSNGKKKMKNVPERQCTNFLTTLVDSLRDGTSIEDIVSDAFEKTELLVNSERSYLFVFDKENQAFKTKIFRGVKEPLVISADKGIIGKSFKDKLVYNIPDAYLCDDFDSSLDMSSDFHTTSLLTIPVLNNRGESVAICQFLNKKDGKPFSNQDIEFANIFMTFCGMMMENDIMFRLSSKANLEVNAFTNVSKAISTNQNVKLILEEILRNAKKVCNAERSSLFLLDNVVNCLSTYIADGEKMPPSIPISNGIAAKSVKDGQSFVVNDAYHDPSFNKLIDLHSGYKTLSLMAVPVKSAAGEILGVVEMLNKQEGLFTQGDLHLLESFATFIAASLEKRRLQDVTERGTAEIEMSKWIGEYERKSFNIPTKLQIPAQKQQEVQSINYFSIEWNGIGLFKVAFFVFNHFRLLEQFDITNDLFFTFLYKLRECYNEPPYHNWIHAIDVLQYFQYQIKCCCFDSVLTGLELLSICTAAIAHDAGHEGFNNVYNVNAQTPLGILFKDQSVMEMYHCTVIIRIIAQEECNIFHAISVEDRKKIWFWITQMILATDMAHHFKLVKNANDIMDQGPINLSNPKHRLMAMTMLMKVSDISNVSRPFEIADKWCDVLCEEFWRQGDMELAGGLQISSALNERGKGNKPKGQVNFYTVVCMPLYQAIARIFPELEVNLDAVKSNLEKWKQLVIESEKEENNENAEDDDIIPMTEQAKDDDDDEEASKSGS
ncbi:hypothetical protein M9Y10_008375 [Tritrichomonas musculus]|uniref:PDEase domain-containing protein n=1 Tax=Tritrichomonas musculus TaxID=1915356 RepID=A0ABR2IXZ1_9EUKA